MANNYATHLSPKDYAPLNTRDYGSMRVLKTNYAKRIAKSYSVDYAKLEQLFETAYGRDWHTHSYTKLRALAKVLPKLDVNESYYKPEPISRRAVSEYRARHVTLDQSYAFLKAIRVLGKSNVKKCYAENNIRNASDLADAVIGYRMLKEIDGPAIAKAMRFRIPTLANIHNMYRGYTTRYDDKTPLDELPEHMRDDVKALAKEVAVRSCMRDYSCPNWQNMAGRMLDAVSGAASNLRCEKASQYACEESIELRREKLSGALANLYAMLDLDKALNTVGLEIDRSQCRNEMMPRCYNNTKIEPKLIRAVNTVLKASYDDEAKRSMINNIMDKLKSERGRKRTNWLPQVARCAEKEAK